MFNFNKMKLVVNENYSFVGIEKCNSELRFYLPKGFKPDSFITYDSRRDLFFLLYKVLGQFKNICIEKDYLKDDRDGTVVEKQGSIQKITLPDANDEEEEAIIYSKLNSIDAILDLYDELKILSMVDRLGISDRIDYGKIHKFLHNCMYINNAPYIDLVTIPKKQVLYNSHDIVGMYCYIVSEIKQQLKEEISSEIKALANDFNHRYIGVEYSLFSEEYCLFTVSILQDALTLIEHQTSIKDVDYWLFHDAIELFLYGEISQEDGEIWGISNFHSVWESICLTYIAKNVDSKFILYIDTKHLSESIIASINNHEKIVDLTDVFIINKKNIVPDVVIYAAAILDCLDTANIYLMENTWNDYQYQTTFISSSTYFKSYYHKRKDRVVNLRIAYKSQEKRVHTILELKKYYGERSDELLIDSRLPPQFYSYWDLQVVNIFDKSVLALMKTLNHIFYVAIERDPSPKRFYNTEEFSQFLLKKLDIDNYIDSNILLNCLTRDYEWSKLMSNFETFVLNLQTLADSSSSCFERFDSRLKIIDVKYLDLSYFMSSTNINYLKEKSVRKQFVYEYLLQQHIKEKGANHLRDLEIESSFWLPSWRESDKVDEIYSEYLNGYINLNSLNFSVVVNNYFD